MKIKVFAVFLFLILCRPAFVLSQDPPKIEVFSPQGTVKGVRQASVRFSDQMVPFGDPRAVLEPFEISCPEKGSQRWADGKNWVYDFERDIPAGVICRFVLKPGTKTADGREVSGQTAFSFSTGGPSVKRVYPRGGRVDEEQIFIIELDAKADQSSIAENVSFSVPGIFTRIGVEALPENEGEGLIGRTGAHFKGPFVAIKAKLRFPEDKAIELVWGKGVRSESGVATEEDQSFSFHVRGPFRAEFHCDRENPQAKCLPISPMQIAFSAPVLWKDASKMALKGPGGRSWKAMMRGEGDDDPVNMPVPEDQYVSSVFFRPPFPENAGFIVEMPKGLVDDAGRKLANDDRYPLAVKTDDFPPLAKFAARFGIIELNSDPALPVTLRNIEPSVAARMLKLGDGDGVLDKVKGLFDTLKGRVLKIGTEEKNRAAEILIWLDRLNKYDWAYGHRENSMLAGVDGHKSFSVEKPNGKRAFEVVGIPFKGPGFYVVEVESVALGTALLGKPSAMYVPAAVLVTNLSAHFKEGRESSVVWVTALDTGRPVKDARVEIADCSGKVIWRGETGQNGLVSVREGFDADAKRSCRGGYREGLLVTARLGEDMSFVHTSWDNGIEPWRFRLDSGYYEAENPTIAHTILDRTLLRAGETAHMKHVIRKHAMRGMSIPTGGLPAYASVIHNGSGQKYEFPVKWDDKGVAETTWRIPKEARLGNYSVVLSKDSVASGDGYFYRGSGEWFSGSFRVEEFRVPLMKGVIQPLSEPLVSPKEVTLDLSVKYLAGGGAVNQPVRLRSQFLQKILSGFDGFEDFTFANGEVKEGVARKGRGGAYYLEGDGEDIPAENAGKDTVKTQDLVMDAAGGARLAVKDLPDMKTPAEILAELEFKDPNGETQTVSSRIPLWPSKFLVGIKPDSWAFSKDSLKFHAAVVDTSGDPVKGAGIKVELFEQRSYSHRKRLVGGFYAYEHVEEIKTAGPICEGRTDSGGLLACEGKTPGAGSYIIQASTRDGDGNESVAHREVWVAGKGRWWFNVQDSDRIDVLPEKKRYEPGEVAKFQVRMPFNKATALVTIEREGVIETMVKEVSGEAPVIKVPIKGHYAPNVYVSVMVVRGRVSGVKPTALVDLGRPAYKLGIAEINVGWRSHELKVKVKTDKDTYKIRGKALVKIAVRTPDGKAPPPGAEVALAAVDEGLLELQQNASWDILKAMMGRRPYEVRTSTAQMHVVGKRHFGLKALPHGGGGGRQTTRELFDTLLLWKGRVALDGKGEADVEVPLNDSVTGFRIVAVATGGAGLFGTGSAFIRTTQDLMLFSGIAPVVREGDRFTSVFTVRNTTARSMEVEITGKASAGAQEIKETVSLKPGEAKEIGWNMTAPPGAETIAYEVEAKEKGGSSDRIKAMQKVARAVQVRTFQATIAQVEKEFSTRVKMPEDAIQGRGGIKVALRTTLAAGLTGVSYFMNQYPYTCLEQKVSRAVALKDDAMWKDIMAQLPSYLDSDGLAKYFPTSPHGSEALTSYILSISGEAGMKIPSDLKINMSEGLARFVNGSIHRGAPFQAADLSLRKLSAIEALSKYGRATPEMLNSITIEPNLWPTSGVIDWFNILKTLKGAPEREKRLAQAGQILRSRLNFQGATMGFSTEEGDRLWWLMVSTDVNAIRTMLSVIDMPEWKEDMPRLVRGALSRQRHGAWDLTTANAWGVVAFDRFSSVFEKTPVTGATTAGLEDRRKTVDWGKGPNAQVDFIWPEKEETLSIVHEGKGKPWATVQSLAAIPLKTPFSSGYAIRKTITPVERKEKGVWSRGDIVRIRLEIDAQADMTWVAVTDPVPAGSTILGSGLGRDSAMAADGERSTGRTYPAYTERSFESFRSYYEFVPKGKFSTEYTIRLNQSGLFNLPPTRAEALYSPEMLGELPNGDFEVR